MDGSCCIPNVSHDYLQTSRIHILVDFNVVYKIPCHQKPNLEYLPTYLNLRQTTCLLRYYWVAEHKPSRTVSTIRTQVEFSQFPAFCRIVFLFPKSEADSERCDNHTICKEQWLDVRYRSLIMGVVGDKYQIFNFFEAAPIERTLISRRPSTRKFRIPLQHLIPYKVLFLIKQLL